MSIRNPMAYMASIWDWKILTGCFGNTKIMPTDIDGFVERHGQFLFLETKGPGVPLPVAQEIGFKALVKHAGALVIIIWGEKDNPQKLRVYSGIYPDGIEYTDDAPAKLKKFVAAWYNMAERL